MRFIADENIPGLLIHNLTALGHDVLTPAKGESDLTLSRLAIRTNRIILTLDKNFTNTILFPPKKFNILHIALHPANKTPLTEAVIDLVNRLKPSNFKGLIMLTKDGFIRYTK